jgi:hypothetical protein
MRVVFSALTLVAFATLAPAQVLYSSGFEAPGFNPGALHNQSGWFAVNGYNVSTARAKTGNQSVEWDNEFGTNASINFAPYTGTTEVMAEVSLWIDTAGASTERSFGLTLWSGNSLLIGMSVNSAGLVRASDNIANLYTGAGVGNIGSSTGRWLDLGLRYTPGATSAIVEVESFSTSVAIAGASSITIVGLFSDYDNAPTRTKGYYDDLSVQAVPEPATMTALALGAMALLRRRRQS